MNVKPGTSSRPLIRKSESFTLFWAFWFWSLACFVDSASAGINQWTSNGPEGGTIGALAVDPLNPLTLYAGTAGNGVFKSTDGGQHWQPANTGLTNTAVTALAIDPVNPTTLYASTDNGVFKSTDGAISWQAINTGLTNTSVAALAIDPVNPTILYAGTNRACSA